MTSRYLGEYDEESVRATLQVRCEDQQARTIVERAARLLDSRDATSDQTMVLLDTQRVKQKEWAHGASHLPVSMNAIPSWQEPQANNNRHAVVQDLFEGVREH